MTSDCRQPLRHCRSRCWWENRTMTIIKQTHHPARTTSDVGETQTDKRTIWISSVPPPSSIEKSVHEAALMF